MKMTEKRKKADDKKTAKKPSRKTKAATKATKATKAVEPEAAPVDEVKPKKMGRPKLSHRIELEEESLKLKNEKYKLYLINWRKDRDRLIGLAIVEALKTSLMALADAIKKGMDINKAIDRVIKAIDVMDLDIVLSDVEVEEEDEADE